MSQPAKHSVSAGLPGRRSVRTAAVVCCILAASAVLAWGVHQALHELRYENQAAVQRARAVDLANEIEYVVIGRLRGVTRELASVDEVISMASGRFDPDDPSTLVALNTTRITFNTSLAYVLDANGLVVACTPYGAKETLTGNSYAFRPYFQQAIAGEDSVYLAVGVTTGQRGIYFSSPVLDETRSKVVGVVVIKEGFEAIDRMLEEFLPPAALVSPDGVVMATNRQEWMYKTVFPIPAERLSALKESKQFANLPLDPLEVCLRATSVELEDHVYGVTRLPISVPGWQLVALDPSRGAYPLTSSQRQMLAYGSGAMGFLLAIIGLLVLNTIKLRRAEDTIRLANETLESRVQARTMQLEHTNRELKDEIAERQRISDQLRTSERRLADIIEFLPDPTFVIDREGRVTAWNRAMQEVTRIPANEILGEGDYPYAVPFYGKRRPVLIDYVLRPDEEIADRYPNVEKRGDTFVAEVEVFLPGRPRTIVWAVATRLRDEQGRIIGAIESVRDITDRKDTEEALRASEAKYRELIESVNSIILRMDAQGKALYVNPFAERFFGYARQEIIGRNVVGTIVPKADGAGNDLERMILDIGKHPEHYAANENENIRKSGERVWIAWTNRPILDADGNVVEILCVGNDVTERKRAERALRESEHRLRVKLDFILSPEHEALDFTLLDLIAIEDLQRIQDAFAETNGVASIISHVDGEPITEPSNFCGVCELVRSTEEGRKRCILSDKQLGEKARQLMKPTYEECHSCGFVDASAPIIVGGKHIANWLIGQSNVMGVDEARIRAYATEIGADAEAMLCAYRDMTSASLENFEKTLNLLWILAQELSALGYNNLLLAKDNMKRRHAEEQLKEHAMLLKAKNVELEAHRQQLKAQQMELVSANHELEEAKAIAETANRVKSEFLANMSHEIRTPLTAILGFTEILLDPDLTDDEHEDCIQTIHQNGKHLLAILNDVLDLSKVEAGRLSIERMQTSPVELMEEVSSLLRKRAEGKNLFFEVLYNPPIPKTIVTDPTRLRQILINLIGNAIKFTECGGVRIAVSLRTPRDGSPTIAYEVMDTGIGMTKEQMGRLFKPFVQADCSTTRRFGGTGLGLTICKRLAEMLGGGIFVDSSPNVGSTFTAYVDTGPLDDVEMLEDVSGTTPCRSGSHVNAGASSNRLEGVRVLLVEDGPDNQRLICHLLKGWGAEVTVAENGRVGVDTALAASEDGKAFDLILMDMHMPILDGFGATEELRDRGVTTPIVALTAYAMHEDRQRCLEFGCDGFATKPIERTRLLQTLFNVLGEKRRVPDRRAEETPAEVSAYVSDLADDADMAEIVGKYVEQLPERVAEIRAALDEADLDALHSVIHNVKGSAGSYGFGKISELAAEVLGALREDADLNDLTDPIEKLIDLCERATART